MVSYNHHPVVNALLAIHRFRENLFQTILEPWIVHILGPLNDELIYNSKVDNTSYSAGFVSTEKTGHHLPFFRISPNSSSDFASIEEQAVETEDVTQLNFRRRLGFLPSYISTTSDLFNETSMSFSALSMLFVTLSCVFLIFLSCFYHNQKTSPLFTSPRRHRLPKLVPPPLPVDGYFNWVKVCFYLSDEEIINRIGFDSLIFIRFHRLALRCIVKMSVFSFIVLLPLNYTGGGHANAKDLKEYVDSLFFTDFLRFTMANVKSGSPRLWIHCFAAYLLTAIVVRELLVEYENFNSIRHRYLLSREPHLRTVLVTNIPRHLRSSSKITNYFQHVYPEAVKSVFICQNLIKLEKLISRRTAILHKIEQELLLLCRSEKKKLHYEQTIWKSALTIRNRIETYFDCCCGGVIYQGTQERLAQFYNQLEELNNDIENEQRRRKRVMKMLDRMSAGEGSKEIDYVLASPFVVHSDPSHRQTVGLPPKEEALDEDSVTQTENNHTSSNTGATTGLPASIPEGNEMGEDAVTDDICPSHLNRLRSRSPPTNVLEENMGQVVNADRAVLPDYKKKRKTFAKARRAIRRYGRSKQDLNFLAKPINNDSQCNSEGKSGTIEDHINEVTDKAFVVMRTFTAATIAIQSMHSSKPGSMQVSTAPEPRDILWDNIYMSKGAHRTRSYLGEFVVLLIITFYIVPVAMIALLVSEQALVSSSPKLAQLAQASAFFSAIIALVQPLCVVGLQQLLPPLFIAIGRMEGITSFSEVQMRAFSRYFLFQVLNVFLVTTIAGSIFDTIAIIVENPESAFEMLGNSLPRMSSFFITFVTIKTFLGLGFELVRTMALVQATARTLIFPNATLRAKRMPIASMRAIDDPGWFPFHKILAQDMLVVVISVVFAVVAPLVTLPCALFCLCSRIMWTHHHLYVYESIFESGGQFWPKIFRRFVFGLIIAQMTITGQFILKEARHEAYATILLMFLTYVFLRSTRARYDPTSSTLPLEVATVMDISLKQDETMREDPNVGRTNQTFSLSPRHQDSGCGVFIGPYDPFQKAYLQPALRANPRARPEQPFPAAQLGREETFHREASTNDSTSTDGWWHDGKAAVRLKSMNQNDRRLINRWWHDQLQRAGKQNNFLILIGEECGNLTISPVSSNDYEYGESPSFSGGSFV